MQVALRKRPVEGERIESLINGIVRKLETSSEGEVTTHDIGALVMEALKSVDGVAYVRFASVYRDFEDARDFEDVLDELAGATGDAEPRDGGKT